MNPDYEKLLEPDEMIRILVHGTELEQRALFHCIDKTYRLKFSKQAFRTLLFGLYNKDYQDMADFAFSEAVITFIKRVREGRFVASGSASPETFLKVCYRHHLLNELRKHKKWRRIKPYDETMLQLLAENNIAAHDIENLDIQSTSHFVQAVIEKMDPACEALLRLQYIECISTAEIKEMRQIKDENEYARLRRQLYNCWQKLRKIVLPYIKQ
jgi:DNA-directed RNA polymerase specialized sigma24 family protein